jgi:hypothetical protein
MQQAERVDFLTLRGRLQMSDVDAEDLIAHLSGGPVADRAAFRLAAENTLVSSPQCSWGPGLVYRVLVAFLLSPAQAVCLAYDGLICFGMERRREQRRQIEKITHRPPARLKWR